MYVPVLSKIELYWPLAIGVIHLCINLKRVHWRSIPLSRMFIEPTVCLLYICKHYYVNNSWTDTPSKVATAISKRFHSWMLTLKFHILYSFCDMRENTAPTRPVHRILVRGGLAPLGGFCTPLEFIRPNHWKNVTDLLTLNGCFITADIKKALFGL